MDNLEVQNDWTHKYKAAPYRGHVNQYGCIRGNNNEYQTRRAMSGYTLVLGGGAHLGAVQAGQLHALAESGVVVNRIIGVSVGALNGSWISRGLTTNNTAKLIDIWMEASTTKLFDRGLRRAMRIVLREEALSSNERLRSLAELACPVPKLEEYPTAMEVVTCNLTSGTVCYHQSGNSVDLVVASCSMPGVFPPVVIDGERHVDGGVLDLLPWRRAGNEQTIVLDCKGGRGWHMGEGDTALSVLLSSFALARHHRAYDGLIEQNNLILVPGAEIRKDFALKKAGEVIEESYQKTKNFIAEGGLREAEQTEAGRLTWRGRLRNWRAGRP